MELFNTNTIIIIFSIVLKDTIFSIIYQIMNIFVSLIFTVHYYDSYIPDFVSRLPFKNKINKKGNIYSPNGIDEQIYSNTFIWYNNIPIYLIFSKVNHYRDRLGKCQTTATMQCLYICSLRYFKKSIHKLIIDTLISTNKKKSIGIYVSRDTRLNFIHNITKRKIETLFIDDDIIPKTISVIKRKFSAVENVNKTVILFHGPPGTGKTSTIITIAGILNKNICYLDLDDFNSRHKGDLIFSLRSIDTNCIALIEDIDRYFTKGEKDTKYEKISQMLNILDGVISKQGMIIFCTMNDTSDIPKAILRDKRCDLNTRFDLPDKKIIDRICDYYNYSGDRNAFTGKSQASIIATIENK